MANVRTFKSSFAGGEMSPEMFGRINDEKFQSGAAKIRNFIVMPQGPIENRAGFEFVREVKDSTKQVRLISFTYSTTQTMVIEVGAGYFRFHTQGATLLAGSPAAYNGATAYVVGDLVSESGTNYYCIQNGTGQTPSTSPLYWYPLPSDAYEIPNPYSESDLFDIHHVQSADVMTLVHPSHAPRELRRLGATQWTLVTINFGATLAAPTGLTVTPYIPPSSSINVDTYATMTYVVTAIDDTLANESSPSTAASASNNIYVTGARNTIAWTAVSGASRYYVYRLIGGIYGYIGNTTGTSIVDDNINPDLSRTPPIYENDFVSTNNYPGAVSYFEQRRCFAGTILEPQKIWMTKSGTESNMSYGIPISDDDRIEFRIAAREANTIRHIVPLTELLLMTGSAEWRVTSVNSDAITPNTISVRPQSYVGASNVQPVIINNSMVYAASRGGHVRELGYNWQANGFITGDLSLRAAHLFDSEEIVDMAYTKAPQPLIWFVSSSGRLLGLTYVPEQQIGAWHWHDTDGVFESSAVVAEGSEDLLYCVIRREINGVTKRYVERMLPRSPNSYAVEEMADALKNAFFVDSGLTYNGTNTSAVTMTISGGTSWGPDEVLTITSSSAKFVYPGTTDVGDEIVFTDADDIEYHCRIVSTTSTTVAQVQTDKVIPVALRSTATTVWAFARNSISGLSHLEGKEVSVLTDGAVHPRQTVTSGVITLNTASVVVTVGLPFNSDLETLPLAIGVDNGMGQGRFKNINKAWLRVFRSSGIFIGPNENMLVEAKQRTTEPYGSPPGLKSQEIEIMLTPSWADSGKVFVRQSDPLPLTIVGMTLEVAIGG